MVAMLRQYSASSLFKQDLNLILSTLCVYICIQTHYLNDKYSDCIIFKHLPALRSLIVMVPLPSAAFAVGMLLIGRVLDRDKDGDTQPRTQPASQRRLWEQRGQCVWPAMPHSHLGEVFCFPAAAHLLAELLDVLLHHGQSAATIATGLPGFFTFPSRNNTDFSQIRC